MNKCKFNHNEICPCFNCNPDFNTGACGGDSSLMCDDCEWDTIDKIPDGLCFEDEE